MGFLRTGDECTSYPLQMPKCVLQSISACPFLIFPLPTHSLPPVTPKFLPSNNFSIFFSPIQFPLVTAVISEGAGCAGTNANTCFTPRVTTYHEAPPVVSLEPLPIPVAPPRLMPTNPPQMILIGHRTPYVYLLPTRVHTTPVPTPKHPPPLSLNQTTTTPSSTVINCALYIEPILLQDSDVNVLLPGLPFLPAAK